VIDLVCLAADRSVQAALEGVLNRHEALGIRPIRFETLVHPNRDSGCFVDPGSLLAGYARRARHALVVFDRAWEGSPPNGVDGLQRNVEASLQEIAPAGNWGGAVVIDPELEAWVFSDSPHVATTLAWPGSTDSMRRALRDAGLWDESRAKPEDPKRAMDWVLRRANLPRSSSLFRALARRVSLRRCVDPSFRRLLALLQGWFGDAGD